MKIQHTQTNKKSTTNTKL